MDDVKGKVVVITGGGGAIGGAMARAFAAEGAKLALTDINATSLERVKASLPQGTEVLAVTGDLTVEADVVAMGKAVMDQFGVPDIVINNAAVSVYAPAWEVPIDLMQWMYDVNVLGTLHVLRQFIPAMIARGTPAHLVNIASMAGMIGAPTMAGYNASKHAVVGLTDALRGDIKATGAPIDVTLVAPGAVKSAGLGYMRTKVESAVADPALKAKMLAILDHTEEAVRNGIEPEDVARQVLVAVKNKLFWVTCPPQLAAVMKMRADEALAESEKMKALLTAA
jgi:NAD(P)-dependent dehydrogenase (short-subunit alcohol dehydrogenase family)